mmetsp:Transcript_2755/g.6245  ORF Transcript_2755/g.6245 Transcript_2755/m.6245 type:complete len:96 (-) Transcript_2755:75-362(-)
MLPRACMGIVVRHFLEYRGEPAAFKNELSQKFPCCLQPMEDLKLAFDFWVDLRRCVDTIADLYLQAGSDDLVELRQEMRMASDILAAQQHALGLK